MKGEGGSRIPKIFRPLMYMPPCPSKHFSEHLTANLCRKVMVKNSMPAHRDRYIRVKTVLFG